MLYELLIDTFNSYINLLIIILQERVKNVFPALRIYDADTTVARNTFFLLKFLQQIKFKLYFIVFA